MLFSVIIPLRNLSYTLIFETLPALDIQTYKTFEVVVLPNLHNQYDLSLLKKYKWLRIIPTGSITRPAEKRDIGSKNAKGSVLAFIDDDAYPKEDWLRSANRLFKKKKIEALCGPGILPQISSTWERIFDEVVKTFIGSGGYGYRFIPDKQRYVDDYPSMNFFIKKNIFDKLGGFNSDFWPGEDSKLCEDLVYREKGKILYSPDVVVYHHRRKDLQAYLNQHANYGFHRGAFFAHGDRNSQRISYIIPTLFLFYAVFFFLLFSLSSILHLTSNIFIFYIPAIIYLFFIVYIFFLSSLNSKNIQVGLGAPIVLVLTHIVYGLKFINGFFKGLKNKKNIYT